MNLWQGVLLVVGLSMVAACGTSLTPAPDTRPADPSTTVQVPTTTGGATSTSAPAEPDAPAGEDQPIVDWTDSGNSVGFAGGWSVTGCEGEAPLLCVEKEGAEVGVVEAAAYPVDTMDWFDPSADTDENLAAFADDFVRVFSEDRAAGCGDDYVFEPLAPQPFVLGNSPGVFFGFRGSMSDGTSSELNLHYATLVDDTVVSIVAAAYDEGGCPGRDDLGGFTTADLERFRPHLESLLHESPLPPLDG